MVEWRLFPEGTVPHFTTPAFFAAHPWVDPAHQAGHAERTAMTAQLIREFVTSHGLRAMSDLGCGDGSLLAELADLPIPKWGYDAGHANVRRAQAAGLDVRRADLFSGPVEVAELVTACEVVEHLADPHTFVKKLPGRAMVLSSPSAETDEWHYVHHAWAWDMDGYADLVTGAGWEIVKHVECDAAPNRHQGQVRPQRFQAIACIRAESEVTAP